MLRQVGTYDELVRYRRLQVGTCVEEGRSVHSMQRQVGMQVQYGIQIDMIIKEPDFDLNRKGKVAKQL